MTDYNGTITDKYSHSLKTNVFLSINSFSSVFHSCCVICYQHVNAHVSGSIALNGAKYNMSNTWLLNFDQFFPFKLLNLVIYSTFFRKNRIEFLVLEKNVNSEKTNAKNTLIDSSLGASKFILPKFSN